MADASEELLDVDVDVALLLGGSSSAASEVIRLARESSSVDKVAVETVSDEALVDTVELLEASLLVSVCRSVELDDVALSDGSSGNPGGRASESWASPLPPWGPNPLPVVCRFDRTASKLDGALLAPLASTPTPLEASLDRLDEVLVGAVTAAAASFAAKPFLSIKSKSCWY